MNNSRSPDPRLAARFLTTTIALSLVVMAVACVVLVGWIFGIEALKRVLPQFIEMNPMSAVNFILLGGFLLISSRPVDGRLWRGFAWIGPAFVLGFGVMMLCKYLVGWDLEIDRILFTASMGANRMAPNTALNFILSAAALLSLNIETRAGYRPFEFLTLACALIALLALVGYGYGVSKLYGVGAYVPMALHVAGNFLLLSVATLCARPASGLMANVISVGAGGMMIRRLLLWMVTVPLLLGWLMLAGQRAGFYDAAFGFTLFVLLVIVFLSAMIWRNASALDRHEGARDVAEHGLRDARDELDARVQERTAELASVVGEIKSGIAVLGRSAVQLADSSAQLAANASSTAGAVTDTTSTITEVRQAAQLASGQAIGVADRAQESARIARAGRAATREANVGMQRVNEQMEMIAASMARLSQQTLTIAEIIASVEELAEQSNLLAVNAAIEAANAGEHGRGFAVVAEAIRHLAGRSREATKRVRAILSEIKKAAGTAVLSTQQGTRTVADGAAQGAKVDEVIVSLADRISEAAQAATQIAGSSREQFLAVEQVVNAMRRVQAATSENEEGARQLASAAQNLGELGQRMQEVAARFQSQP